MLYVIMNANVSVVMWLVFSIQVHTAVAMVLHCAHFAVPGLLLRLSVQSVARHVSPAQTVGQ